MKLCLGKRQKCSKLVDYTDDTARWHVYTLSLKITNLDPIVNTDWIKLQIF